MIEPSQGFTIDDADYRWGTLPGDVAGVGALPTTPTYLHQGVPCGSILELATVSMTVSAPAPDRPVMTATYELAAPRAWNGKPDHWIGSLRTRLGAAATVRRDDLRGYRNPSDGVACWANWHRQGVDIGLSIYGGVRVQPSGNSAGLIYLTWTDTIAAAAPFLPAWYAASAALEDAAQSITTYRRFDLPNEPGARSVESASAEVIAAKKALYNRDLYATPRAIRERLGAEAFALWNSGANGQPALSTPSDSVLLRHARVRWTEIQPAKGGGYSELAIGGWWVRAPYGAAVIAQAAAALEALPGVIVEKYEGYDV